MTPRPPFRRNPDFAPICYEIPCVLDFSHIATQDELGGEPPIQQALLLAYRESGRMRVVIWAHGRMFSDSTFEAAYADTHMGSFKGGIDNWSHREFCEYLEFLSGWTIGKPISFTTDTSFEPVPQFSQRAQEIFAFSELGIARKSGEAVH
ncbi:hypothetical protein [Brucella intermedia]|uniref:hypothetical protein n=1 Tax=Brucella intermedia TaxID=94625 RepID=UPI000EFD4A00|nr:hypothetical protein [Brucella intermedia]KAB2720375.1 hypothetical protein F9K75_04705 [Brucella intermedia]